MITELIMNIVTGRLIAIAGNAHTGLRNLT
jgi:hypothetical protein